jgi:hypothetical protein
MIGVICSEKEKAAAKEFFELFKTPWEFFEEGTSYDVLIRTTDDLPGAEASLCIIFNPVYLSTDTYPITPVPFPADIHVESGNLQIPIYSGVGVFGEEGNVIARIRGTGEAAGIEIVHDGKRIIRLGYNLFEEVQFLISRGQPSKNAALPALDLQVAQLRRLILQSGIPLLEIPPTPAGYNFIACLTHDVDFVSIRRHRFNHTLAGFLHRAMIGSVVRLFKGRLSFGGLIKNWLAVLSLPFVHLGILSDFWSQFKGYMDLEKPFRSTFFVLPFSGRPGKGVTTANPERRSAAYDITDIPEPVSELIRKGFEIGLHGIDAWHNTGSAIEEKERIKSFTNDSNHPGVRMHWLCFGEDSFRILDEAGFDYDSTFGYNDTAGYRAGTAQAFQPLTSGNMLELPFQIQDVALFYPGYMNLPEKRAWDIYRAIVDHASVSGGAVTSIWHMRSIAPERLWDKFYVRLLGDLKSKKACFFTAHDAVRWFRTRRGVTFEEVNFDGGELHLKLKTEHDIIADKPLLLRVHIPRRPTSAQLEPDSSYRDFTWSDNKRELHIPLNSISSMGNS